MIPEELRAGVARAHHRLAAAGLVTLSFGNASGIDRSLGLVAIKPSGIPCDVLQPRDLVVVALEDGRVIEGGLRPSSDTPTHLELYRRFPAIGGVVHTHSRHATAWSQAGRDIPCLGTTHADHFRGSVPVSRPLTDEEIDGAYEAETGRLIADTIEQRAADPSRMPAILVRSHGPFTWGRGVDDAVDNAIALEEVAAMALAAVALEPAIREVGEALLRRHFDRKHGPGAYYGQTTEHDPGRVR